MQYQVKVQKSKKFDVAVVGGGTAGVFAAIAAARSGACTVLIEKNSRLGGTVTAAGVNYPGLFFAWGKQIIAGPCFEAIERTIALGGAIMPEISYQPKQHHLEQIHLNKLIYLKVINDLCREAGVTVLTSTMISFAEESAEGIRLLVTDKSGLSELSCGAAIDCTGDADLTRLLGYPCRKSEVQQPATPDNRIAGYEVAEIDKKALCEAWSKHPFSRKVTFDRLLYYLNIHKIDCHIDSVDADLSEGREALEVKAIEDLYEYLRFLRGIPGLEGLYFDYLADESGVRESNRIIGESTVTAEEYIAGYHYPDSVAYAFYPIDLHVEKGIEQVFLKEEVVPKIPYGALIPKDAKRLLCAGRMVSSDTYANSALRVQAPCMAMGQAAGVAAALAVKQGCSVKDVALSALRRGLEDIGAIVP